ncbi:MAG: pyrroline-5-carboxylate reductase [Eggerthellaceae bacterium]
MKLGFIGCGNMAKAIIKGVLSSNLVPANDICASNATEAHAKASAEELGISVSTCNATVVSNSDAIFLSVKPYQYEQIIAEIKDSVRDDQIIVTIAPGKTIQWLTDQFGKPTKIIRTAPNTPALVGEGLTAYHANELVSADEVAYVVSLLESFGSAVELKETLLDVSATVGGCTPAYTYMFIEAIADAGVAEGLTRQQAYQIAAQAVMGSAKMVLETGKHPGELKDQVTSPSGSTIVGVQSLEEHAFRGTVIRALRDATAKSRTL